MKHSLSDFKSKVSESVKFVYDPSTAETYGFLKIPWDQVNFPKRELSKQLANGQYYVPSEFNSPLIDSFLVNLDFTARSAHLQVLQMTTSEKHGESKQGMWRYTRSSGQLTNYSRNTIQISPPGKKLKGPGGNPSIQVHYVLVCPDSQVQPGLAWQLPKGWRILGGLTIEEMVTFWSYVWYLRVFSIS